MDFMQQPTAQSETAVTSAASELDSGAGKGGSTLDRLITDSDSEAIGVVGRDAAPRARARRELDRKQG